MGRAAKSSGVSRNLALAGILGPLSDRLSLMSDSPLDSQHPDSDDPGSDDPASEDSWIGRMISGRYRVIELIAKGGMGAVYLGEHVHLRKRVAIKTLLPEAAAEPQLIARFEREAIVGAHIEHPHVAGAMDFGQEPDGTHFLVLEYVRGQSLAREIDTQGPLEVTRALRIARELALALQGIHEKDIVHRDIKPANVMLTTDGDTAKLVDFGFAKLRTDRLSTIDADDPVLASQRDLTLVGTVFGTVSYMPPEIARGMAHLDARADLYALGVTLYEMLAGVPPFTAKSEAELFHAIVSSPPPPIGERAPGVRVPDALEAVVLRLLEKNPDARYQTASELLDALDAVAEECARVPSSAEPSAAPLDEAGAKSAPAPPLAMQKTMLLRDSEVLVIAPPEMGGPAIQQAHPLVLSIQGAFRHVAEGVQAGMQGVNRALDRGAARFLPKRWLARLSPGARRLALVGPPLVLLTACVLWLGSAGSSEAAAPEVVGATAPADVEQAPPSERPRAIDGVGPDGWRERLVQAAEAKLYNQGADAFLALGHLDRERLREPRTRAAAVAVIVGIAFERNERADAVFEALTGRFGEVGLELLYEIVRSKRGTQAYQRTVPLLDDPKLLGRASPGLQVAFALLRANCPGKRELFDRAVRDGDERVLTELKALKYAKCSRRTDPCCFREDKALTEAIEALGQRLEK